MNLRLHRVFNLYEGDSQLLLVWFPPLITTDIFLGNNLDFGLLFCLNNVHIGFNSDRDRARMKILGDGYE